MKWRPEPFGMWMSNSRQRKERVCIMDWGGGIKGGCVGSGQRERACMSSRSGRLRHMEVAGVNVICCSCSKKMVEEEKLPHWTQGRRGNQNGYKRADKQ